MTTYMYGEDPAEAMESAAARERFREWVHGERDLPITHWQYRSQPWGVRADGPKHEHSGRIPEGVHVKYRPSPGDEWQDKSTYTPTTGITPRTLEMLREIREAVRVYDRAVLSATIERNGAISAIERKYL